MENTENTIASVSVDNNNVTVTYDNNNVETIGINVESYKK